jgi:diaminopimelate epimerase
MKIPFTKTEGLGNDFLLVPGELIPESFFPVLAAKLCERHFGVGADGLVYFWPCPAAAAADFRMRIFNADGGEAEMSGNGLRCLAAHLFHAGIHAREELKIEAVSGLKQLTLRDSQPPEYRFAVDMGAPVLEALTIPFRPPMVPPSLCGFPLDVAGKRFPVTITSMGNPHCSLFVDNFEEVDWKCLGPLIEHHPFFPNRTNVEFIRVINRREIEVRFWERGVGVTLASGTGSCGAMVASRLNGFVDPPVQVHTTGGDLEISWQPGETVRLLGPARVICSGEFCCETP